MGGVKLVLKNIENPNYLCFELPAKEYRQKVNEVLTLCKEKTNGYCTIELNRPYKPRTTGKDSQNNLTWKLIQIIADETGEDVKEIEHTAKVKAITKGYPYHVSKISGEPVPESMTKINTIENSYLIETLYEIIAFLGIQLSPDLVAVEPAPKIEDLVQQAIEEPYEDIYNGGLF